MSDPLLIPCPHCNGLNRIPAERLGDAPRCGRCKSEVLPGVPITLTQANFASQLKGDLPLLVDVWASWCGPCRAENPNVVKAFQQFRDKNFTILGVSLDQSKEAWIKAIKDDHLSWTHISDLKEWNSSVVDQFGFGEVGIPYNILVDPQGKIIAERLRGDALQAKLAEVLH